VVEPAFAGSQEVDRGLMGRDEWHTQDSYLTHLIRLYNLPTGCLQERSPFEDREWDIRGTSIAEFLTGDWEHLAATDFFTVEVWTKHSLVTYFVLFVIELATGRVHLAGITTRPDTAWMKQIARNLTNFEDGFLREKRYLLMDRDGKFGEAFRSILEQTGVDPVRLPTHSPNVNAIAERFVRSVKSERIDRMIFFGETLLRRVLGSYLEHYHRERNHQGRDNRLIEPESHVGQAAGEIE
jgi:putative transposase